MFDGRRQTSVRSFLLGGLLGGLAGVLAAGRLRSSSAEDGADRSRHGLGPFEEAPCHREWQALEARREAQKGPID